jgi:hypothetical protein
MAKTAPNAWMAAKVSCKLLRVEGFIALSILRATRRSRNLRDPKW